MIVTFDLARAAEVANIIEMLIDMKAQKHPDPGAIELLKDSLAYNLTQVTKGVLP